MESIVKNEPLILFYVALHFEPYWKQEENLADINFLVPHCQIIELSNRN